MRWRIIPCILAAVSASCLGTPQPDPPNMSPELLESIGVRGDEIEVRGAAGTISPGGALVRIASLERSDPVVEVVSDARGAFSVLVPGLEGEEMRLQVVSGEERSLPVDVVFRDGAAGAPERPLGDCFLAEPGPEIEVPAGDRTTLRLVNDCDEVVVLSRVALRRAAPAFTVIEAPTEVASGSSADVVLSFEPDAGGEGEDILLVECDAPAADRRPVTLVGR